MTEEKIELIIDEEFLKKAKEDNFKENAHIEKGIETKIPCTVKIGEKNLMQFIILFV